MTEKSVLERLREDLAKVCDARYAEVKRYFAIGSHQVADCAAAIRAHDLSSYESATQQTITEPHPPCTGGSDSVRAADPDVAGFPTIARLADLSQTTVGYQGPALVEEAVRCWYALQRQADQLAEVESALRGAHEAYENAVAHTEAAEAALKATAAYKFDHDLKQMQRQIDTAKLNCWVAQERPDVGGSKCAALEAAEKELAEVRKDATPKFYRQCLIHGGMPWYGLATVQLPPIPVCPNCERDAALSEGKP